MEKDKKTSEPNAIELDIDSVAIALAGIKEVAIMLEEDIKQLKQKKTKPKGRTRMTSHRTENVKLLDIAEKLRDYFEDQPVFAEDFDEVDTDQEAYAIAYIKGGIDGLKTAMLNADVAKTTTKTQDGVAVGQAKTKGKGAGVTTAIRMDQAEANNWWKNYDTKAINKLVDGSEDITITVNNTNAVGDTEKPMSAMGVARLPKGVSLDIPSKTTTRSAAKRKPEQQNSSGPSNRRRKL